MSYVLTLLPKAPDGRSEEAREACLSGFRAELARVGGVQEAGDGAFLWNLDGVKVIFSRSRGASGGPCELEAAISFGAAPVVEQALTTLLGSADEAELEVFDPQLGQRVNMAQLGSIIERFESARAYSAEYAGVSEAGPVGLPFSASSEEKPELFSQRVKVFGVVVVGLILGYMLLRVLVIDSFLDALAPSPGPQMERPSGPPPGWLEKHPPSG